jgi:hypothetical protein
VLTAAVRLQAPNEVKRAAAAVALKTAVDGWLLLTFSTPTAYFFFAVTPLSSTKVSQPPKAWGFLFPFFTILIVIGVS